ncbi:uncharacterized protein qsm [Venturia canescens]|uniref:uncharacterized protein qsm n=1 Tax=Venturia canescens TaxID=32260 RepID=UPI001C9D50D8|nr:uncharacterized protein LOC122413118 [Venturia canescens]
MGSSSCFWILGTVAIFNVADIAFANVQSKVRCSQDLMEVDIVKSTPDASIYLQQLKDYPDEACKPTLSDGVATFRLALDEKNMSRCGIARVVNKITGQKVYYHRIVVEEPSTSSKSLFTVKCIVTELLLQSDRSLNHTASRRSVLPAGFQEAETDDAGEIPGEAPIPSLGVGVRQGGTLVTGELNVSPGTPLQMEIFLDEVSAPIYGLLVTYMQVTDTKSQEETIIFNGCSVDPYLFENFNTVDGDFLTAKFRAFKFPESTYVQFRGTVNVCLDKCQGVECSNGHIGFGRKRRAISMSGPEMNREFEVTMSTFIKVDFQGDEMGDQALSEFIRKGKNRTNERSVIGEEIREQFIYKEELFSKSSSETTSLLHASSCFLTLLCLLTYY